MQTSVTNMTFNQYRAQSCRFPSRRTLRTTPFPKPLKHCSSVMAASVALFPRSKSSFAATQRLTCRNALCIALAFIVFEVGFMTGQVGRHDVGVAVRGLFYHDFNISEFGGVEQQRSEVVAVPQPVVVEQLDDELWQDDGLPLSLRRIYSLSRESPDAEFHRKHRFSQPLVLQAYVRHKARAKHAWEIVIITTGVSMGTFERKFIAAGCMIADQVYPVDSFLYDRAVCTIPKGIEKGTPITLVIYKDDIVEEALRGPVTIEKEFVAELEDGDLRKLEKGTELHGELAMHELEDLLAVNSRLVYEDQLDPYSTEEYKNLPRYEMCLGTQIKPSTHLLPDWLDYHRRIGVDFVYVFDNHADEDVSKLLEHRHDVEVIYWPWEKSQIQAFTYAVYAMRSRCEWLFLMDTDEYVMIGLDGQDRLSKRPLPLLKQYTWDKEEQGYSQIWFHWVIMKNSGHVDIPRDPVPEAYIHMEDPQIPAGLNMTLGKTLVSMDKEWLSSNAHAKKPGGKVKTFDDKSMRIYPKRITDLAMIVHYRRRSWVEFREKVRSGRANINNPRTASLMEIWDSKGREEYKVKYMRHSLDGRKEYTWFRDIWRRVTREMNVGKSVTAKFVNGARCRTIYDFSRREYAEPMKEVCEDR